MVEVAFEKARELANRATAYLLRAGKSRRVSRSAARMLVIGALGVVLLLAACSAPAPTAPSASPAVAVAVAEATQGAIQQTLSYSGELRAPAQVSIVAKAGGTIQQISVGVGSHVTAGDVLAVLDPANAQAQVIQSQAAVSQARAKLASIQAGARDDDVAAAQATLNQQKAKLASLQNQGRPEDVRAAQSALEVQQAKLDQILRGGRPESIVQALAARG